MAETVIERCARAILADYQRQIASGEVFRRGNGDIRMNASSLARAVAESLRNPDPSMIDAGNEAMREALAVCGVVTPDVADDTAVEAAWQAMLNTALEEG